MQSTITYLLTEQAQRAQMAATGQPVARKQTYTAEIAADDLALLDVTAEGQPYLDLSLSYGDAEPAARAAIELLAGQSLSKAIAALPYGDVLVMIREARQKEAAKIAAALQAQDAYVSAVRDWYLSTPTARSVGYGSFSWDGHTHTLPPIEGHQYAYHVAVDEAICGEDKIRRAADEAAAAAQRIVLDAAVQAFLADPDARASAIDTGTAYWVTIPHQGAQVHVTRGVYGYKPTAALGAEAQRRKDADAEARETAKREYLAAWISEHGTPSQKARQAENLLCREEAIGALADATFAALNAVRYTAGSRPTVSCSDESCESCDAEDCHVKHSVQDGVDCLSEGQHANYTSIRAMSPGATYILRTHTAQHDCDHDEGCRSGSNVGVMVKIQTGPFMLQREYEL